MKNKPLIISLSGVRGIAGESLTAEVALNFGKSFGTYLRGRKVILGRDSRVSGPELEKAMLSGLKSSGCQVIRLGIVPTPTCQVMVEELAAGGGVAITASHNPRPWNGLKFIGPEGIFLNRPAAEKLLTIYREKSFYPVSKRKLKKVRTDRSSAVRHLSRVLKEIDVRLIRARKLKVALDCCNGAGVKISLSLLKRLGARVECINCTPDGNFPHHPEPVPAHLRELGRLVKKKDCDIGFALDPDADRLAMVTEKGRILSEEYTLALTVRHILSKRRGVVVCNLSTSLMIDDVAAEFGCRVVRTAVGEIRVVEGMKKHRAVFGGEGNGGVIDPRVHYGRDSLVGIAIILQFMAESGKTVTELSKSIPAYYRVKKKIKCSPEKREVLLRTFKERYTSGKINSTDGVKVSWPDSWLHVRPSGTEPVIRLIAEARKRSKAEKLIGSAIRRCRNPALFTKGRDSLQPDCYSDRGVM